MTTDFLSEISPIMRQKNNFFKLLQVSQKKSTENFLPRKVTFQSIKQKPDFLHTYNYTDKGKEHKSQNANIMNNRDDITKVFEKIKIYYK